MNWYSIFYWITRADNVKNFFDHASDIFTWFTVIGFIVVIIASIAKAITCSEKNITNTEEEKENSEVRAWEMFRKYSTRMFYVFLPITLVLWLVWVAIPTKKDCLLIVTGGAIGSFVQSDTSARQLPADLTAYLHLSLKKEISELSSTDKAEIGVDTTATEKPKSDSKNSDKEALVNSLKNLSKDDIKYIVDALKDK